MATLGAGAQGDVAPGTIRLERLASGEPYTLALPAHRDNASPAPLIVSLHYGGAAPAHYGRGLLEQVVEPALRALGAVMVAPDCPRPAWLDCEDTVLRVIEHVLARQAIDPSRIVLTGYSKGGIGAWDLGTRHADRFSAAIPMAGRPGATADAHEWTLPVRAIQAGDDEVFPPAASIAFVGQLRARGVDADIELLAGVTHFETPRFIDALRRTVPWLLGRWSQLHPPAR